MVSWWTEGTGLERGLAVGATDVEMGAAPGPPEPRKGQWPPGVSLKASRRAWGRPELARRSTRDCDPQADAAPAQVQGLSYAVCFYSSASKSKELSPGSGQKGSPGSSQGTPCTGTQPGAPPGASPSQPPPDQSPHTLRKGTSLPPFAWVSGLGHCLDARVPRRMWILRNRGLSETSLGRA